MQRRNRMRGGWAKGTKIPKNRLSDWQVVVSKYGVRGAVNVRNSGDEREVANDIRKSWDMESQMNLQEMPVQELLDELLNVDWDNIDVSQLDLDRDEVSELNELADMLTPEVSAKGLANIYQDLLDAPPDDGPIQRLRDELDIKGGRGKVSDECRTPKQKAAAARNAERMREVQAIRRANDVSLKEAWAIYKRS